MESEYLHFGLNLVVVLVLMVGLAFLLKKIKQVKYSGHHQIKVIHVVTVGAKEKIILMEAQGVTLLIGATANHIATLHRFNELTDLDTEPAFKKEMTKLMEQEGT